MIDIHSHLLPGVDDGADSLDASIDFLQRLKNVGFNEVVITPHIYPDLYENDPDDLNRRFDEMQKHVEKYFKGDLKIYPGSEVYLAENSVDDIANGNVVTLNRTGKYILFEIDLTFISPGMEEMIKKLQTKGYHLIWAHPERNSQAIKDFSNITKMIDMDVLLQINLGSLNGSYGDEVRHAVIRMLQRNMVHLIGSDCHCTSRRMGNVKEAMDVLREYADPHYLKLILEKNAKRILEGKIVYPFPYRIKRPTFFSKVKKFLGFGG